jgi:SAM-dependent methyltransferase
MSKSVRRCPLCKGYHSKLSFPFIISYKSERYYYYRCSACATVFLNPLPSDTVFSLMYTNINYHEVFYDDPLPCTYDRSAEILSRFSQRGALVLDYGCGTGSFLKALQRHGFTGVGVELSVEVANIASQRTGCHVYQVNEFFDHLQSSKFDIIYLGDVLEHLPDPEESLAKLLPHLKVGGLLMVEGPLETNHSPVYWASVIFGSVKRLLFPGFIGRGVPTHLFRTSAKAQKAFFERAFPRSQFLLWSVYETGWPYSRGNLVKRSISFFAKVIGGKGLGDIIFGNRFRLIISVDEKSLFSALDARHQRADMIVSDYDPNEMLKKHFPTIISSESSIKGSLSGKKCQEFS